MANPNFNNTTTAGLLTAVPDYNVSSKTTDGGYPNDENRWTNTEASKYYGNYYNVGEYRSAINSFATWVIGQGYSVESVRQEMILEHITGWGEDTFESILWQMIAVKKFNGDAYAEIIIDEKSGVLINLKPLDPRRMTHITNKQGRLIRYEYSQGNGEVKQFKPNKIFHLCNDRILDEPHGTAVTSAVEWCIEAIQEARRDWRRLMHRSAVRIIYVDEQDTTRQEKLKTELANVIKNGDIILIPCKPEEAQVKDLEVPAPEAWIRYLEYLEDKFYKALGVPKVVLGGTADNTEASAKVGVISYEPIWVREITELELDVWNQLGIKIKINKQPSLMENMQADEKANTGQTKLEYQGTQ